MSMGDIVLAPANEGGRETPPALPKNNGGKPKRPRDLHNVKTGDDDDPTVRDERENQIVVVNSIVLRLARWFGEPIIQEVTRPALGAQPRVAMVFPEGIRWCGKCNRFWLQNSMLVEEHPNCFNAGTPASENTSIETAIGQNNSGNEEAA